MTHLKYSVVAVVLACVCSSVSAVVPYSEDFESFAAGTVLHEQAGWEGWYGDAGAAARVSATYAFSGTQSVEVASSADAVQVFDITEGKWVLTAMQYIPSGTNGVTRFHMQNQYRNGEIGRSVQWSFSLSDGVIGEDYDAGASATIIYDEWVELKLIIDLDNDLLEQYYNGELFSSRAWVFSGSSQIQSIDLFGNGASSVYYDDFQLQDYLSSLVAAHDPSPEDGATDVPRDAVLDWVAGRLAETHDVYFGTNADDVANADPSNPLDVLAGEGQGETGFDPEGLLDFGTTYYWRVDEVSATDDEGIYKGDLWSFTTEPFAYAVETIVATSNATSNPGEGPENTINGSGLNENDAHSTDASDMWVGIPSADPPYIQYEFDRVYKLHEMLVWNYNAQFELILGFGFQDVTVEYSTDGAAWTALEDAVFAQATAQSDYASNTTLDFAGGAARYVRLTANSGYGAMGQFGLSEVRFMYLPVHARLPQPADDASAVSVATELTWRAGRDALSHDVYFGTDPEALALAGTAETPSYTPETLDMGVTYYWKVDEIQDAESWDGDLWSFVTQEFIVVDDFESYDDEEGNRIYEIWADGWVNETGSTVGYAEAPFAERTIVHGGRQAMPLFYNNVGVATSEADLALAQDWTASGIQSLSLYFQGAEGNSGELYVKINGTKMSYTGDAGDITSETWVPWTIDLSTVGGNLNSVTSLIIGIEGAGATGVVYFDDIELHP
jgi:F5/8 type C domain-containing protein